MLRWYPDSLGKITGGYGHLQRPGEEKLTVTKELADKWFDEDSKEARGAAEKQASQLPFCTPELFAALVSVNFQLGTGWTKKFPKTWGLIVAGKFDEAAWESENSLWAKQTPVRVRDLQRALWRASVLGEKVS